VALAVLRKTAYADAVNALWREAHTLDDAPGCVCPLCDRPMQMVRMAAAQQRAVILDVCPRCAMIWFDTDEFWALPIAPDPPGTPGLPPEAREAIAILKVQEMAAKAKRDAEGDVPAEGWKVVLALLGFPVEVSESDTRSAPWLTWALTLLVIAISSYVLLQAPAAITVFGFIPAHAERAHGLTFLTPFFLHGGLVHLLGNMYFLLVFGRKVEDYLGRLRFALLLVLATFLGNLAHLLGNPASLVPCIGASGGIAGILACYALAFPRERFALIFYFRWVTVPAYGMVCFWVLLQCVGVWQQLSGYSHVSALAHLGGAAAGLFCWLIWRHSPATPPDHWQQMQQGRSFTHLHPSDHGGDT